MCTRFDWLLPMIYWNIEGWTTSPLTVVWFLCIIHSKEILCCRGSVQGKITVTYSCISIFIFLTLFWRYLGSIAAEQGHRNMESYLFIWSALFGCQLQPNVKAVQICNFYRYIRYLTPFCWFAVSFKRVYLLPAMVG